MSESYAILKIEKVKSLQILSLRQKHNFRQIPVPNADINRRYLNKTLVNEGIENYVTLWESRKYDVNMNGGKCNPRQGAVYAYEIVLGYSHDAISDDKVNDWAKTSVEWLEKTFGGKENVLSAVLHMDEYTPHIHAIVMPIDERNRLCARSFTGGKVKMFNLQTSYANAVKEYELNRPEMYTKAKNKDLKRFYRAVNSIVNIEAPVKKEEEKEEDYITRCETWVKDIEFKSLDVLNKVKKENERLLAKQETYNLENKEATHLNNILIMKYCGNTKRAKKILLELAEYIDSVDIETLEYTLQKLLEEFVEDKRNILAKDKSYDLQKLTEELEKEDLSN